LTEPGQVERALAAMWKQSADEAVKGREKQAATRVCMANLIVVGREKEWDGLLEVLGELSPVYPTRTIVVLLDESGDSPAERGVRASVTALCHVPQPDRPQVCCDQIVLRSRTEAAADLDRTLLPLLESDVPVMVWWTLKPGQCSAFLKALRGWARRIIFDCGFGGLESPEYGGNEPARLTAGTEPGRYCAVRELGWYRVQRWRELLAGMFDEYSPDVLTHLDRLTIEIADTSPELLGNAIWIAAFMGGQLGWIADCGLRIADCDVAPKAHDLKSDISNLKPLEFMLHAQGRMIRVSILQTQGDGIVAVTIGSGKNTFEARRCRDELRMFVHNAHICGVPRCVQLPRRRRSEALAAALTGRQVDAAFDRAAPIAAWMVQQLNRS